MHPPGHCGCTIGAILFIVTDIDQNTIRIVTQKLAVHVAQGMAVDRRHRQVDHLHTHVRRPGLQQLLQVRRKPVLKVVRESLSS